MKMGELKKITLILAFLGVSGCSGKESPNGFYRCEGFYKSLEFNNGEVIVDLGFMKSSGSYKTSEKTLTITLDGKSLVFDSEAFPDNNPPFIEGDFRALVSPMIQCVHMETKLKQNENFMETNEGKEFYKTPGGKETIDLYRNLAKEKGISIQ